ncbi:MAG: YjbQ family protein [Nitrospirae bacterium]|nr:YjbQ family protein [Nitrospirota bacterium]
MVFTSTLSLRTTSETDILDLTPQVARVVEESGVREGLLTVFVPGSTASVTTIEYESGAVNDLRRAIERIAPRGPVYEHDQRWGDMNGYAHVRAALLGPSVAVPISRGKPALGTWQQIVLCDFDNRPRERHVIVHVLGE